MQILRWLGFNAATALTYFALGALGLAVALPPGFASAIWPAAGMAFAITALWGGKRVGLGIFLGSVLTNATVGGGFHLDTAAIGIAAGSTLQALVGGYWLNRLIPNMALDGPNRVVRFSVVGVASSVIAASVGNVVLLAHGFISLSQVPHTFITWWLGDAFGVQIFAPLTLLVLAPNATWKLRRWSVGLPLVVSFMLCGLVYYFVLVSEERRLMGVFSTQVEPFESELRSLDRIQGHALRQLAASYNARGAMPGSEFAELAIALQKELPGIRVIAWAPVLDAAGQKKHPGGIRHPPGFSANANGFAAPVTLFYPHLGNGAGMGLDMLGEPLRAQAVQTALASKTMGMTEPIHLAQEPDGPGAVLLMAPVQNTQARGVIIGVMDLRLIDQALKGIPGIVWQLSEVTAQGKRMVRQSHAMAMPEFVGPAHLDRRGVYKQRTFKLADREWHFQMHLPHSQLASQASQAPLLVLLLALLSCGVVSTFALIMSSHRERVEVEVKEKTAALSLEIGRRKSDHLALEHAKAAAESANFAKGQFLANMSHEIRTPMNAILGLLHLLQTTELTARQRDYASKTEGAAQSLLGLLNDILDFSKIDAGKMTLENEPFRLDHLLRNLAVVLSANVGNRDIEVLFDIDPALPEVVRGDAMRLQQVLVNLGGNAVKFTTQGQVVLSLRQRDANAETVVIEFAVQDSGIGIAPEHQAHIFSGFSQAESSTTRRFGGTGLGLAISKRFVELMGGDIQIASTVGVGSTFSFVLELACVTLVPVELRAPQRPAIAPQRVLVVDDNPIAGALTLRMVTSWGWDAVLVDTGSKALDLITQRHAQATGLFPFPLIYMDGQMPHMDGWETTRRIRQFAQHHALPQPTVIMLTARGRETLAQRSAAEQDLLNGFLVKPVTASVLFTAMVDAKAGASGLRQLAQGRSSKRQLSGMRILVVEDNLINQQVAEELLTSEGAIVSLASNGRLGADAVAAAAPQFDVVLMDIQMPVLDGYGATQVIRKELGLDQLPIIAMTANAMASDRVACLAAGMSEHIGKPFDMAKLVSLLIRLTHFQVDNAVGGPQPDMPTENTPVPDIAGLDLVTALGRMSGMRSLYLRTARDFSKLLDLFLPELQRHLTAGEQPQALMRLHTLKGNAATLGANDLADKAAALESLCKTQGGLADCEAHLGDLATLITHTQQRLAQAIAQMTPVAPPSGPAGPASVSHSDTVRTLRELDALVLAADLEVLQRFAVLRGHIAHLPGDFCDRLDNVLQNLDLAAAHTLCEEMLAQIVTQQAAA
jgi:signal transduction histidine kinase/CheY-like chemotaxis protein